MIMHFAIEFPSDEPSAAEVRNAFSVVAAEFIEERQQAQADRIDELREKTNRANAQLHEAIEVLRKLEQED